MLRAGMFPPGLSCATKACICETAGNAATCCSCLQEGMLQTGSSQPGLIGAVCSLARCAGEPHCKLSSFSQGMV